MMKAKAGMLVTEMSGSLGGHTFQNSKGGFQIRNKPIPRGNPSPAQQSIRSINPVLQRGWQALTREQQEVWNAYAVTHNICNKSGDPHPLSGHSLWMKYNFEYLVRSAPAIIDPSLMGPPYLGPELITLNNDFSTWAGVSPNQYPTSFRGLIGATNAVNKFEPHVNGLRLLSDGTLNFYIYSFNIMTVGIAYRFKIIVDTLTGGFRMGDANLREKLFTAPGVAIYDFVSSNPFLIVQRYAGVSSNVVMNYVSLKRFY